ncbi:helix-turn-helix domain-containing protein [Mycolicibacterium fluoranthenivorans]|uniref:Helix-turn-helix domain-containing protein n=1 Tax=Mycolicibacterium fluoranthenivorans TaxID=258505 RepID=A0A7G8PAQ3_9MYCO|nr:helix-turn-helix domain-containing protein [Mycolicibacterium fluoranthenivorans]QNJ91419.1 helix-turn-helix domain-containing protein [Mycolicibacterium fluoranthenivorans]
MITLDRLVNVVGGYGVAARLGEVSRSTELRSVVVPEAVTGDVLLALGASSLAEALRWAADAHATVVLARCDPPDADTALPDGIAVLLVDPALPWSELAAVVYGLVLEGRETESGRGPTDLFALADSLAAAIGGAVVIEDRHSQTLAYSRMQQDADDARVQTILRRQQPTELQAALAERGVFAHLAESGEPLFLAPDPELGMTGRMVVAARVGRELLGSVWVSCPAELPGAARAALTDGARVVALHLLRSRASADLERQVESDSVLRLLDGSAEAATVASRVGLPPGPLRVIAMRARLEPDRHTALLVAFEQATAGFGWSRPGRSALADNTLYTVLPGEQVDAARQWLAALRAALPERTTVLAGISGPADAAELAAARREADECLALHETDAADAEPPAYDEAWDALVLRRLRAAADAGRGPSRGPVAELLRHDTMHGTPYVTTLRVWLAAQGDPARAGAELGVHENTVRYRLRKMAEVATVEVDDPGKRLAMMIELAALERG